MNYPPTARCLHVSSLLGPGTVSASVPKSHDQPELHDQPESHDIMEESHDLLEVSHDLPPLPVDTLHSDWDRSDWGLGRMNTWIIQQKKPFHHYNEIIVNVLLKNVAIFSNHMEEKKVHVFPKQFEKMRSVLDCVGFVFIRTLYVAREQCILISLCCHGDVMVMAWWCHGHVMS